MMTLTQCSYSYQKKFPRIQAKVLTISVDALEGKETLIITLKTTAPKPVQQALIDAAAAAGVTYVIPNDWGLDPANRELSTYISCSPHENWTFRLEDRTGRLQALVLMLYLSKIATSFLTPDNSKLVQSLKLPAFAASYPSVAASGTNRALLLAEPTCSASIGQNGPSI